MIVNLKLKNEDWKELLDKEPRKDLVPDWVKKMLGDDRVEALQQKAVTSELLDGVKSIDKLGILISKGMSLEDALLKLSVLDRESLHKIYKGDIYRDLRNTDEGLRGLLERVEVIRNPWIGAESRPVVGASGRVEAPGTRGERAGNNNMAEVERLLKILAREPLDGEADETRAERAIIDGFRNKNQVEFQIFNQVNYRLLDDSLLEHLNTNEWEDSRGGAPAYVNRETLGSKEKMDAFILLWRDRTRLALRKIAYQQSERSDPVMTELTTLLSIVGIPSSEKGMIKVESQIYGMVDALMRGEGNADTFAKLFTLFTSNGVGFRLIDNLKNNREKVYWVKGGIYAGGVLKEKHPPIEGLSEYAEQMRVLANQADIDDPRKVTEILSDKGTELRVGVFDFMRNMGDRLTPEELLELRRVGYITDEDVKDAEGQIENIKWTWGTAIYRKSVDSDIDKVKKVFLQKVLKGRGKTYENSKKNESGKFLYNEEFEDLYGFYGDYIDEAVYFKAVHAETDTIVGNASLKKGSYEFAHGLKEYLLSKLSIQGSRYFEAKYLTGNVDEMVGMLDGGIRSLAVMARTEVVNHFIGEKATTEGNLGAEEVFFSNVADSNLRNRLAKGWNAMWSKALYHHGNTDKLHHDPTNMFTSFGDEGSIDSGLLRPVWNTIKQLKEMRNSDGLIIKTAGQPDIDIRDHLEYEKFADILHDKDFSDELIRLSKGSKSQKIEAFDKFIDRFGEDYRSYSGEKSKRWSDWPVKYWIKKMDEAYTYIQELSSDPYSVTVQKKLLDLYTSTNAAGTPAYQRMMQEAIEWYAKDVGAWGTFTRYKKKIDGDRITMVFDAKKGIYGDDQEFPGIANEEAGGFSQQFTDHSEIDAIDRAWQAEHRAHPKSPSEILKHKKEIFEMRNGKRKKTIWKYIKGTVLGDPALKTNSLAASYGHGAVGEWTIRQMLLERRAAGFYKNQEQFSKEWGKWAKGILWNKEKTVLENGWNWFTLNAPFEYVGMVYFGIQGHKLREIFAENTEKNMEKMLHYLNS